MKLRQWGGKTLRRQLLVCFLLLAILPLLLNVVLSYFSDRKQILENRDQIATMDVRQISRDLEMELEA